MPATIKELGAWKARYEEVKGWNCNSSKFITFGSVPNDLQSFVRFIETKAKREVVFVSTHPGIDEGMLRVRHGA